ncbi:MAG: MlaC/ttg2D family ABC transporter substrate-binding protein [Myxococcota bacterium]
MSTRGSLRMIALFSAVLLVAPFATAAEAEGFVKAKQGELLELVRKSKGAADDRKVEDAFDNVLDYDALARETLKEAWAERTPEERAEFQQVLKKLVRGAYRKSLKRISDYTVEYKGESAAENGQIVRTVAKSRNDARQEPVSIDYVVHQVDGKWRVADIVTEGSSLVANYRNQFRRIIKKDGFPALIKRMKAKLDKGDVN